MQVKFSFTDKYGTRTTDDEHVVDMDAEELLTLFNVDQIIYPYKMGESTGLKYAKIKSRSFNLYRIEAERILEVELEEIE